ncbi:hypothetical protein VitviT2T_010010 [Vitis vinifera]|uniref:Uncharacterized protein n=1 Tax=Vitis vinifera TaxID=29760 RepID=A0ABY9C7A9_VITVI|nr:hypothetical protein VitviT2T_010010 [Vitis vinifera]
MAPIAIGDVIPEGILTYFDEQDQLQHGQRAYPDDKDVKFRADGSATYMHALGLELDLSEKGLGTQSKRFALLVDDLKKEQAKPSLNEPPAAKCLRHRQNVKQPLKLFHFPSPPSDGRDLFPGSHFQCSAAVPGQDLLCRQRPSASTSFQKHRPECGALGPTVSQCQV